MNVESMKTKRTLPVVDLDAELRKFEEEERKRLGLDAQTSQWIEDMANLTFTKKEKAHITILVNGKKTVDWTDPKDRFKTGHFALQQHDPGSVVKFRKIEVKELEPETKESK